MKQIFITGTTSGFGKQALHLFIKNGDRALTVARGGERRFSDDLVLMQAISEKRLFVIDGDLENRAVIAMAATKVDEFFSGKLDVLINNAGFGALGLSEKLSESQLRSQFEVNFFAPALLIRELTPALKKTKGKIINISSIVGLVSLPFYGIYSATKHALEAYTESLSYEYQMYGIQVALVEPGGFKTDFNKRVSSESAAADTLRKELVTVEVADRIQTKFQKMVSEKSDAFGQDPKHVAKLLFKLVQKKRMPLRNVIGTDANAMVFFSGLLPDVARTKILKTAFRMGFLK